MILIGNSKLEDLSLDVSKLDKIYVGEDVVYQNKAQPVVFTLYGIRYGTAGANATSSASLPLSTGATSSLTSGYLPWVSTLPQIEAGDYHVTASFSFDLKATQYGSEIPDFGYDALTYSCNIGGQDTCPPGTSRATPYTIIGSTITPTKLATTEYRLDITADITIPTLISRPYFSIEPTWTYTGETPPQRINIRSYFTWESLMVTAR